MTTSKTISVVIPSYNHSRYIKSAVDSVLSQNYEDIELIVVDDGSTDNSLEFLRQVQDPRFVLIEQENAGAHNAINRGLARAKGTYLTILNSDDLYTPGRLKKCIETLDQQSADLVTSWIEVIDAEGIPLGIKEGWWNMLPWAIPNRSLSYAIEDSFERNLLVSNFVSTTSNIIFTRRLYERVGGMRNLRFAHDWDFMLRAAENHLCVMISEPLMQYRIHGSNTISSNRRWMLFEICWVLATGLKRFESTKLFEDTDPRKIVESVHKLFNSINLQGNDKVFWIIRQYISSMESKGIMDSEIMLLDDAELRQAFLDHVIEETQTSPDVNQQAGNIEMKDVIRYAKTKVKKLFNIH